VKGMKELNLDKYENFLNQKKATKELLLEKESKLNHGIESSKSNLKNLEEAADIMNTVGILVQQEFEEVVQELVTQALRFVFDDSYSFEVESKILRSQPEIHLFFNIGGERYIPDEDSSGGELDVASFALRVILWAIQYDRTEPILLFDEPFRMVDVLKPPRLREMIRYLSEMLGLQFIIVTHSPELANEADRSFVVVREKGISRVKQVEK